VARAAAGAAGVALPLVASRLLGHKPALVGIVVAVAFFAAVLLVRLQGRVEGWKLALVLIAVFALVSVAR
jgi:hypothetical protein